MLGILALVFFAVLVVVWVLAVRADVRDQRSSGSLGEYTDLDPGAQSRAAAASGSFGAGIGDGGGSV
jgi:hypothetical protein